MSVRRIKRPKEKEDVFKRITDGDEAIFSSYKDLMIFAACVGFNEHCQEEFQNSLEPINLSVFSGECDSAIFDIMALTESGDAAILEPPNDKYAIFEKYANGGLDIIKRKVLDSPGSVMDNFINFIHSQKEDEKEDPIDILKGIGDNL
jgi:dnd system-associated protein 4